MATPKERAFEIAIAAAINENMGLLPHKLTVDQSDVLRGYVQQAVTLYLEISRMAVEMKRGEAHNGNPNAN